LRDADGILCEDAGWIERVEHALHDWINRNFLGRKDGFGLILPPDGWLRGCTRLADHEALRLEGKKTEKLLTEKGPTKREAGIIVPHLLLGVREGVLGSEEFIAIEVVGGAMDGVGACTKREVDRASGITSAFRTGLSLRGELINGVQKNNDACDI